MQAAFVMPVIHVSSNLLLHIFILIFYKIYKLENSVRYAHKNAYIMQEP